MGDTGEGIGMDTVDTVKEKGIIDNIKKIGVVGAGVMGQGIIQVFAQSGFEVVFYDSQPGQTERALAAITGRLNRSRDKGEISEEQLRNILGRIKKTEDIALDFRDVDFVAEAVYEDLKTKWQVLHFLDVSCRPDVIIVSNTSSISITQLSLIMPKRMDKFMGMHFMNPPTVVTLIELIKGEYTSQETFNKVLEMSKKIGREIIIQSKDAAGFICNRILMTAINEAIWAVYSGVGSSEDINKAILMTVGNGKAMPILELADLIGLDICLDILRVMHKGLGKNYKPCPLLEDMVKQGKLGRKSGQGFFNYQKK